MDTKRVKRGMIFLAVVAIAGYVTGCNKEPETEGDPAITERSTDAVGPRTKLPSVTDSETIDRLRASIESARIKENRPVIKIAEEELKAVDPDQVLALLVSYENDPDRDVRDCARNHLTYLATIHPSPKIRQQGVKRLLEAVYKQNDRRKVNRLMKFQAKDFDQSSRRLLREALYKDQVSSLTVKLCGVANMREELPRLDVLITPGADPNHPKPRSSLFQKWYYTFAWDVRLARARMGVKKDIVSCVKMVKNEPNAHVRVLYLLPDIGYIRQSQAIEYISRYLSSQDRVAPTNPGMLGLRQACYAMHILSESIEGYPVEHRPGICYSDEEIELCRKWMADRANWKIIR